MEILEGMSLQEQPHLIQALRGVLCRFHSTAGAEGVTPPAQGRADTNSGISDELGGGQAGASGARSPKSAHA